MPSKIIKVIQAPWANKNDQHVIVLENHLHQFYLEPGTFVLVISDGQNTSKLVVPCELYARYLYRSHDYTSHSGVTRVQEHLSSYWLVFRNHNKVLHRFLRQLRKSQEKLKWRNQRNPPRSCPFTRSTTESCAIHTLSSYSAFAESSTSIEVDASTSVWGTYSSTYPQVQQNKF